MSVVASWTPVSAKLSAACREATFVATSVALMLPRNMASAPRASATSAIRLMKRTIPCWAARVEASGRVMRASR